MKLSKSVLLDEFIGEKLFNGMKDKTNKFIKDIYDIDVNDASIKSVNTDIKNYRYAIIFNHSGRSIGIGCSFEDDEKTDDMICEVLHIVEVDNKSISIPNTNIERTYNELVDAAQTYLENNFDLNFTPIDPNTNDPKIIGVEENENQYIWKTLFTQPYHDGRYEVYVSVVPHTGAYINIVANKRHKIYLD